MRLHCIGPNTSVSLYSNAVVLPFLSKKKSWNPSMKVVLRPSGSGLNQLAKIFTFKVEFEKNDASHPKILLVFPFSRQYRAHRHRKQELALICCIGQRVSMSNRQSRSERFLITAQVQTRIAGCSLLACCPGSSRRCCRRRRRRRRRRLSLTQFEIVPK